MESLPDITDQQRQACEKWEVQFNTDHVEILNFAIRYATSSHDSISSIGTSASDVTISITLSQKRSTPSAPTDPPGQTSQQDLYIQKKMLELEVKLERTKIQMEANEITKCVNTFGFLDTGSDTTLIKNDVKLSKVK
ncbi:hypothetical protein OUZ56_032222 [Daphnia magna]|uniref:Peptidase A2 domain-containing protein n=1 Tax=Daphnia magna TaxID=35525 RepID=A0ABQ9ZXB2_9CRUS|nr:hypothetical protein OUZ56_032222 [Daphnia magna]